MSHFQLKYYGINLEQLLESKLKIHWFQYYEFLSLFYWNQNNLKYFMEKSLLMSLNSLAFFVFVIECMAQKCDNTKWCCFCLGNGLKCLRVKIQAALSFLQQDLFVKSRLMIKTLIQTFRNKCSIHLSYLFSLIREHSTRFLIT